MAAPCTHFHAKYSALFRVRDVERRLEVSLGKRSKEEKCDRNNFKVAALKRDISSFFLFLSFFFLIFKERTREYPSCAGVNITG